VDVRRFRTIWKFLVPGWLQSGQGELVQWVEGLILDAFAERCHQSAYLMLPSVAPSDALDKIGSDRGLPRGLIEPEDAYRDRLRRWRYPRGHRVRGNAPGLLEQIALTIAGTQHQTIDARGTRYTYVSPDDPATVERGVAWDWDGEAVLPNWGRFWIVLKVTGAPWPTWGDGAWGDTWDAPPDASWAGSGVHPGSVDAVRKLVRQGPLSWTPAGRRPIYLVIYFDGDPYPAPDGTWDSWENRDPAYRYEPLHESVT
jgi:hypothetical protein